MDWGCQYRIRKVDRLNQKAAVDYGRSQNGKFADEKIANTWGKADGHSKWGQWMKWGGAGTAAGGVGAIGVAAAFTVSNPVGWVVGGVGALAAGGAWVGGGFGTKRDANAKKGALITQNMNQH